ncbi:MAG: hypothetical protein JNK54_07790 [Elusimicrobia bacterium]|jgi:hypothetical protein|nr:hypothetical protein [Elusimicrobiota bacterium]
MNRIDLERRLKEQDINPSSYSLNGGLPSETYVLSNEGGGNWSVYYSERGLRRNEKHFLLESDACQDLLRRLLSDPLAKRWPDKK